MLDLNFVRDNLPLVEEKLRLRGMDPGEVLKDFQEVDTQRRHAISEAEITKARRNRASEEIAKLKKSGQDATVQMSETKQLREQIQQLEKVAAELEARVLEILAGIPNLPHQSVPAGKTTEDNLEVRRWGAPPKFALGTRGTAGHSRSQTRHEAFRCALRRVLGFGGKTGAGTGQLHARSAHS
jgi:seryl-tRNA synthetase